jgi:hypothetical protein
MIIVLEYVLSINRYIKDFEHSNLEVVDCCPCCKRKLWKHATYKRSLLFKRKIYTIPIRRMRCSSCRKTFSLMPFFVTPWMPFANHIREYMGRWLFMGIPLSHLPEKLSSTNVSILSLRTLYRWKARLRDFWKPWYLQQRTAWATSTSGLLPLYRHGIDSVQEREMIFRFYFGTDRLPRQGSYLNWLHLQLTPLVF